MEINEKKRLMQEEAVEAFIKNDFRGAAFIGTGGGKTWVMLKCLSELLEREKISSILYTCDSTDLRDKDFPDEVKKWGYGNQLKKITRLCYQSAYKLDGEKFDVLLADEADYALTPEYIKLFLNNQFKYIIFVSATLEKGKMNFFKSLNLPVVFKRELHELEKDEIVNKSRYFYVNFMLTPEENKRYLAFSRQMTHVLRSYKDTSAQMELLTRARKLFLNRLKSSAAVCKQLLRQIEGRTLIFCELTAQANRVCKHSYHGKNVDEDNLTKFNEGEIDEIAVCGKVDRGKNLYKVQNIVQESCSSSQTKSVQKLGRGKRLEVDDFLNVYMLVPHYERNIPYTTRTEIKPTIVLQWYQKALKEFNIDNIEVFKFK